MTDRWVLYPGTSRLPAAASPDLRGRSFVLRAELADPVGSAEGVIIASGDAQAGFSFFVRNSCLVFMYHHAGETSTTTSSGIDSAATVLAVSVTDDTDGGTVELRANAAVVGVGSIGHLARARLSYTGLDVGQDRGNPVGDYAGPFDFSGSLRRVVVTADPIAVRVDHTGALAIEFSRPAEKGHPMSPHILYGAPVSLYTGRARSYLRKQGIDFVEVSPGSDRYLNHVVPAVGRWIIPVVEAPDGELIQDGAAIIEHFENTETTRYPAFPDTPVHLAVSHVFDLFGAEGLLRPAMHYRWNFDEENLDFLRSEFSLLLPPGMEDPAAAAEAFDHNSGRMRRAAVTFGVTPQSMATIEETFHEWLDLFSAHLVDQPYLLGDRPTVGDYGLMAAMWAHLFRDPAPTSLIKRRAPRVGRWVERMSTSEPNIAEYRRPVDASAELFADDSIPDTLVAMLRYVADEYLAEISAHVAFANEWLAERPELEAGTNGLKRPGDRGIGAAEFEWRGIPITTGVMPYRFWLMQRVHDAVDSFDDEARAAVRSTFAAAGLEPLLDLRTDRRVERVGNLEVWGPTVDG